MIVSSQMTSVAAARAGAGGHASCSHSSCHQNSLQQAACLAVRGRPLNGGFNQEELHQILLTVFENAA